MGQGRVGGSAKGVGGWGRGWEFAGRGCWGEGVLGARGFEEGGRVWGEDSGGGGVGAAGRAGRLDAGEQENASINLKTDKLQC